MDDLLRLDGGGPELPEHGVGLDQLFLDILVGRETTGRLPQIDLRFLVEIDPVQEILGRPLPGGIDVDRDGPRPGVAPGDRLELGAWPHGERCDADLAGDLGLLGIVELAVERGVGHRDRGIAGHEDRVGVVARVAGLAGRRDLVRLDVVPPELDGLHGLGRIDSGLPAGLGQLLVASLVQRHHEVAAVGPDRPEEREPSVRVFHATGEAPLDLAVLLQALRRLDEVVPGLRELALLEQIGPVEEGADRLHEGDAGVLAFPHEGRLVEEPVHLLDGGDVVHRLQVAAPELAPVVVVPDDIVLAAARGQVGRHFLDVDFIRSRHEGERDLVLGRPHLHPLDGVLVDRVWHVADLQLHRLGATDGGSADAQGERAAGHLEEAASIHGVLVNSLGSRTSGDVDTPRA